MDDKKKYTIAFDKIKAKYTAESKERMKQKLINEIKKDNEKGCGCKG
jgi:hypothetical protein